jgi:hypothetical protein
MPIINEYDALTGTNAEIEISQDELDAVIGDVQTHSMADAIAEKAAAKAALLERLGITEEESALLVG